MRFVTCRLPDGVEDPAILSADGTQVWPLSWLGLSYETLSDAIPFLTPQVRAGLQLAIAGIPALPIDAVQLQSPHPPAPRRTWCALASTIWPTRTRQRNTLRMPLPQSIRTPFIFPSGSAALCRTAASLKPTPTLCRSWTTMRTGRGSGQRRPGCARRQTKDYVFGYTILNDVSARDVQTAHKQWYFGKSLDGFTPMGPCIVTADEFDTYPPKMGIRSFVNGEKRQDSNTGLQIFDIDHVIHELTQGMTLKAGTIIATGTPAGVGMGMDPPQFLKPGDTVRCEIDGIGSLTNTVR